MIYFDAIERNESTQGLYFVVENPVKCDDFNWLLGASVSISDRAYTVTDVEKFSQSPPWNSGEKIAIYCDSIEG